MGGQVAGSSQARLRNLPPPVGLGGSRHCHKQSYTSKVSHLETGVRSREIREEAGLVVRKQHKPGERWQVPGGDGGRRSKEEGRNSKSQQREEGQDSKDA